MNRNLGLTMLMPHVKPGHFLDVRSKKFTCVIGSREIVVIYLLEKIGLIYVMIALTDVKDNSRHQSKPKLVKAVKVDSRQQPKLD